MKRTIRRAVRASITSAKRTEKPKRDNYNYTSGASEPYQKRGAGYEQDQYQRKGGYSGYEGKQQPGNGKKGFGRDTAGGKSYAAKGYEEYQKKGGQADEGEYYVVKKDSPQPKDNNYAKASEEAKPTKDQGEKAKEASKYFQDDAESDSDQLLESLKNKRKRPENKGQAKQAPHHEDKFAARYI